MKKMKQKLKIIIGLIIIILIGAIFIVLDMESEVLENDSVYEEKILLCIM